MTFKKDYPSLEGKSINAKPFGKVYTQYVIQDNCLDKEKTLHNIDNLIAVIKIPHHEVTKENVQRQLQILKERITGRIIPILKMKEVR